MEGLDSLQISEDKKKFILELLNPILEEMVAECIHCMPTDPVPFMRDWLEQKKCNDEEKGLSPEERSRIEKENQSLQQQLNKVKTQMQQAAQLAADDKKQADSEEEEDDADDEPPPGFFDGPPKNQARQSVSAEAYGEWNAKKAFVAPVVVKSDEQKERLKKCLVKSFLFSSLDDNDLAIVVGAMKEVNVGPKETIIKQGDAGDFLFVIESGKLDCVIGGDKVVKTCTAGDVFGELALLYNCPRAASVISQEQCVLWQLDRDTFGNIVSESAQKKRNRYDSFLAKVPLLSSMDSYERGQLADALRSEVFSDGQVIMTQGEVGKKFYIIEEGQAKAQKNGTEVMAYKSGDYFGELALIRNQPRAATVTCVGMVRALSIDSASFKRLLNVNELLKRSENMYS